MRVARWKVMAGGLLLSAGGLMAVADGPPPVPGCQPLPPVCLPAVPAPAGPPIVRVALETPIAVPAPNLPDLPPLPKSEPAPPMKRINPWPNPDPSGAVLQPGTYRPLVAKGFVTRRPDGSHEVHQPKVTPVPLDLAPLDAYPPAKPGVRVEDARPTPSIPAVAMPAPATPPAPFLPSAPPVTETRAGVFALTTNAAPVPAVPTEKPAPEPKKPEPAPATAEKRLKVVLHMGDDRPRFEVRDGDETYLKVVSDRVEVKSAAAGEVPTMKAGGKVGFVTPGGDGTCDELTILPGSGQVIAAGNVAFRHTWGRSETVVSAERMTFRLTHPGPTAIQAGYTPVK